jgi:hypothetical protein
VWPNPQGRMRQYFSDDKTNKVTLESLCAPFSPRLPRNSMSKGDSHLAAAAAAAMAADSHHSNGAGHRVHVAGEAAARTLAHAFHAGGSAPPSGGNGMDALRKSTCAPQLCHVNPTSPSSLQCCRSRARSLWSFRVLVLTVALPGPISSHPSFFHDALTSSHSLRSQLIGEISPPESCRSSYT